MADTISDQASAKTDPGKTTWGDGTHSGEQPEGDLTTETGENLLAATGQERSLEGSRAKA
jgi:hypothetical protein